MITRNALRAIAMATTCLVPMAAFAADDDFSVAPAAPPPEAAAPANTGAANGFLQLGIGGVMGRNAGEAGRYDGLNTTGFDVFSAFDVGHRDAWDSGGTAYWDFSGANLNFQTTNNFGPGNMVNGIDLGSHGNFNPGISNLLANEGEVGFEAGNQGTWSFGAYYDAITYTGNIIDSLYSFNGDHGFLNNGLRPFGGATTTHVGPVTAFTIPSLNATGAMEPFQTGTRRDIVGGNFKYIWGDWTFTGAIRHEHKEGTMEESFDGPYSGAAFALPINYDTDRYDAIASYNTHAFQSIFQYTYSHFVDNTTYVTLPYPQSNTAAPYQRIAAYSTPPSNDAHYLTMMLASNNMIPLTRVNLNARVGLELQNDSLPPPTADPVFPTGAAGLGGANPASPNIMAEVYQLKISATSHPITNVDTHVFYGLDARSVSMSNTKIYGSGTGSDSSLAGVSYIVPQDWLKQNGGGEIGYRILPEYDTKLTLGYRFDAIDRSNAQVGHSATNTVSAAVLSGFGPNINSKLSFDYTDRTGAISYLTPWANLAGTVNTAPTYSGAYYQAPMTAEAVTARADYSPMGRLSGGMFVQFKNENYTYPDTIPLGTATPATIPISAQGIKQDYALTLGPDLNFRPSPTTNLHFFDTYELLFFDNYGNGECSLVLTAATAPLCGGVAGQRLATGFFQNKYTSGTHTIGLSGDWKINEKLTLRADYTLSYGSVMFGEFNGVFLSPALATQSFQNVNNYPDINSIMNSVKVTATYQLMHNIELVAQGVYTSLHNNDWNDDANAIQGAGSTAISTLTAGYGAPNYNILALMGGVKLKF